MTVARRIASIEAGLTPTGLVLHWLHEAHAFGDLGSFLWRCLAEPNSRVDW